MRGDSSCCCRSPAPAPGCTPGWAGCGWVGRASGERCTSAPCWASSARRDGRAGSTWRWAWGAECGCQRGCAGAGFLYGGRPSVPRPKPGSGVGSDRRAPADHGTAVALAEGAQLGEVVLGQSFVAVGDVEQGIVERFLLVLGGRLEDAAA